MAAKTKAQLEEEYLALVKENENLKNDCEDYKKFVDVLKERIDTLTAKYDSFLFMGFFKRIKFAFNPHSLLK